MNIRKMRLCSIQQQVQGQNAGLRVVVEPLVTLSPKPLPMTTLLYFMSPNQESRAIHAVVGVHVAQGLSCPRLGHALPVMPLTFSGGALSWFLWPPAHICWHFLCLRGGQWAFQQEPGLCSELCTMLRLPPYVLIFRLTLRGHFAFLFYSQIQGDVLPLMGLCGWKGCLYTFLQILNLLIYELL